MIKKYFLLPVSNYLANRSTRTKPTSEFTQKYPFTGHSKKAKKQKKHVLLDFGSPRCSPCLFIKNKIFTIDSIADFINERFVSVDYTEGSEKETIK